MTLPATYIALEDLDVATSIAQTDHLVLDTGELATLILMRTSLYPNCRFIPPSGDVTGATDTAAIQAAIDELQAAAPGSYDCQVVLLSGRYYIGNSTLTMGAANTDSRVCIQGIGQTSLYRVGAASSKYMISSFGGGRSFKSPVSNLVLLCNYLCRGIMCTHTERMSLHHIEIRDSVESALDLIQCWWSNVYNVDISYCRGFAIRTKDCNASHFDTVTFNYCLAMYSLHTATYTDIVLNQYAMANGGLAGHDTLWDAAHQAEDAQDWPATDDTICQLVTGTAFTTTDDQRAMIYFHGGGSTLTNIAMEGCYYLDYPLLYMDANGIGNKFATLRLEGVHCLNEMVLCAGGRYNVFDHIFSVNSSPAEGECECFLRCTDTTRGNSVNRFVGWGGLTDHIVILDGGTHTATTCTECATATAEISSANWIGEVNSPTVSASWDDIFDSVN